jgi:hypothetical protein
MARSIPSVLYALVMMAVVISVDLLFFRSHFWERLMANVGIVLLFGAFYLRFLAPMGGRGVGMLGEWLAPLLLSERGEAPGRAPRSGHPPESTVAVRDARASAVQERPR